MEQNEIDYAVASLVEYGIRRELIVEEDRRYMTNRILDLLQKDNYTEQTVTDGELNLDEILNRLTDWADETGILRSESITGRDLFDTRLMGAMTPRPSEVIREFWTRYADSPEAATDYFYQFCQDTNYIRTSRVAKDIKWKVKSDYGLIDISINLSKPEKDPRDIAAARKKAQNAYPKCQLCRENEGYAGRLDHPARENLRIIPITIQGKTWGFQYSPYVYYNEHCIVLNGEHVPMKIDRAAFSKLFDFVSQFPHYFLGSNADLPIVGGSILTHDHFQGGRYEFAMARAPYESKFTVPGFEDVETGIVRWPLSVIRIRHADPARLIDLADHILTVWRGYTDRDAMILAETDGDSHNTITPIARKRGDVFELDLALRNNLRTEEHPLGLYHPHEEYHHIKKENIGLIEVMGLAILPARLRTEMGDLAQCMLAGDDPAATPELQKHAAWAREVAEKHPDFSEENIDAILQEEIGQVFVKVLEDAGVYKCTPEGRAAFARFLETL
ncbi:MAG: UDP-glucose--hexose-1-phosphate uridylyltransferase [Acutalibacteraceae bacterium]